MKRLILSAALALTMSGPAFATSDLAAPATATAVPEDLLTRADLRTFAEGFASRIHGAMGDEARLLEAAQRYTTPGIAPEVSAVFAGDIRPIETAVVLGPPMFSGRITWRDDIPQEELRGPWDVQVPMRVRYTDGTQESRVILFQIVETQPGDGRPEPLAVSGVSVRAWEFDPKYATEDAAE